MSIPSEYTTVKLSKELKGKLKDYARSKGLSLAGAIADLLDNVEVLGVLKEIRELLKRQNEFLEEQNKLLREQNALLKSLLSLSPKVSVEASTPEPEPLGLPSFVKGNPWVKIIASRGEG